MTQTMRAAVLRSVGSPLEVSDSYPEPQARGGEIVSVTACGVCHSDLHVASGQFPSPLPLVLGHEVTGTHLNMGPVMVYAPWGCRQCEQCAEGNDMICADATEAGLLVDGGYAEYMRVPDGSYLCPLGDLDPVASAPLACGGLTAYRAVTHSLETLRRPGRRRRVLVIGTGGLGQFALRYLKLLTDAEVYACDHSTSKQAIALDIGADRAFNVEDGVLDGEPEVPPCDVVIDFVGHDDTIAMAARLVVKQGLVVVVGLYGGRISFGLGAVPHEARFMSSIWGSRVQLLELLDLAHREPSVISPVETVPLANAQQAHDRLRTGDVEGRLVLLVDSTYQRPAPPTTREVSAL